MSRVPRFRTAAALAFLEAGPASSHSVIGRVVDDVSDTPLPATTVTLLDSAGIAVAVDLADSTGWFARLPPGPGDYSVLADRMAYEMMMMMMYEPRPPVGSGVRRRARVRMIAVPIDLEGITVSTERRRRRPERRGFYRRRDAGIGYFLELDELRDYRALYTTDVFRLIPGARIRPMPGSVGSPVTLPGAGPPVPESRVRTQRLAAGARRVLHRRPGPPRGDRGH